MKIYTCECGNETDYADEQTQCELCSSIGRYTVKEFCTCHQCNGSKKFWFVDGYDYCSLCDNEGYIEK